MPDRWGEKLIALSLGKRYISKLEVINNVFKFATLGDIVITPATEIPESKEAIALDHAETILQGETLDFSDQGLIAKHLPLFIAGGGSPGGARPKLLIDDQGKQWLYKFNLRSDPFNTAIAEWASLEVARRAGLNVPEHELTKLGGVQCFRIKRFDVSPAGGRYHLLTLNSLLKDEQSRDPHIASYEDIASLIRRYSEDPLTDCRLLLGQMLINRELRNTDDHLRNFSFINKGDGWRLSPVYDVVPDPTTGKYHQIRLFSLDFLPGLEQAVKAGEALGVGAKISEQVAQSVSQAIGQWDAILEEANTEHSDLLLLKKIVRIDLKTRKKHHSKLKPR